MQFMMRSSQRLSLQQPSIQTLLTKCTFHARLKLRKTVLMLLQCHYLMSRQFHKVYIQESIGHARVVTVSHDSFRAVPNNVFREFRRHSAIACRVVNDLLKLPSTLFCGHHISYINVLFYPKTKQDS